MFRRSPLAGGLCASPENSDEESSQAWQNTAECSVCFAPFSASKRRHHCRICLNSVCHLHSQKRRVVNLQSVRVCDLCERSRFEEEVRAETSKRVVVLKQELEAVKNELRETQREIEEKEGEILTVQMKWNDHLTAATAEEERLDSAIVYEVQKSYESQRVLSSLESQLASACQHESQTCDRMTSREARLATIQSENCEDSKALDELYTLLNSLTKKANQCLDWKKASEILCRGCRRKFKRPLDGSTCEMQSFTEFAEASRASSM